MHQYERTSKLNFEAAHKLQARIVMEWAPEMVQAVVTSVVKHVGDMIRSFVIVK
jgi:hypothetical protein